MPTVATPPLTDRDASAIRATRDPWTRACLTREWDRLLALCTDDVVFMPPGEPLVRGQDVVRLYLEAFPVMTEFSFTFSHIDGRGDLAVAHGSFSMTVELEGRTVPMTGKFVDTFRKQTDGTWRYAAVIWNTDQPMP